MSKSRTKRGGGEYDLLDRMKHENQKLKRENARLKKLLNRVDLERFSNMQEVVEKQHKEDLAMDKAKGRKRLEARWKCHKCSDGVLKPYAVERRDGLFYYRSCTLCPNRTKLKPYKEGVDLELKGE
jgi:hypothetical protein